MKKEEGLGRWQTTKCGAKRQAHTCLGHATTVLSCFGKVPISTSSEFAVGMRKLERRYPFAGRTTTN